MYIVHGMRSIKRFANKNKNKNEQQKMNIQTKQLSLSASAYYIEQIRNADEMAKSRNMTRWTL